MLKPQKRFSKKELKQDPLLDSLMKAQTYYEQNRNMIFSAVGILVVVVLAFLLFAHIQNVNEEDATTLLGKAQIEYDQMNYEKAEEFLVELVDEFDGTDAADQGLFLYANLNFRQADYEEAKRLFDEFISSYGGSDILLASGYAGMAACLEQENQYAEAAEFYGKAQKRAGDFDKAADYLYLQSLCLSNAGNNEEAKEVLDELLERFPEHSRSYDAKTQLILLAKAN